MTTALLVSEIFPPKVGGSGRWFWELYSRLPRERYAIAAGEDPRQNEVDNATDLRIERVPLSFPTRFLRAASLGPYRRAFERLNEIVRREDVRSIHAARCLPEGLLALALAEWNGIEFSCFAHGEEVNPSNSERQPPWYRRSVYQSRELGAIVGLVLGNAGSIIANSENTRSILTQRWGLPERKVRLLHPGVDTSRFTPAPADRTVRARLGWQDRRVVLTVGRLQKRKGHDVMIAALPEIRRVVPEVLFAIVGDGEERAALEELARRHGVEEAVRFHDEIDDAVLVDCYRQCDIFALPNRRIAGDIEGFGIVLLEAQACGKPVVAGDSGGTRETLVPGETGLLVACDGPDELAARLSQLLADPARLEAMGRRARRHAVERFDWKVCARNASMVLGGTP